MAAKKKEKSTTKRQEVGRWGEGLAADYLCKAGFEVCERNIRTPEGEIDLVARSEDEIRFVEVKTRTSVEFGYPEEAVETMKLEHMQAAAEYYLDSHPENQENWHLDVIAVMGQPGHPEIEIQWIKDVDL